MEISKSPVNGILAYITTEKDRYLGGQPLGILAKDMAEATLISEAIAEAFLADVICLENKDLLIIKKQ